ncbi:MAG: ArgR family transcriptional regulator [Treponemataceae bacterium]|nr:ArgR family transcriptional regulator [Treponemataceae bacterium]
MKGRNSRLKSIKKIIKTSKIESQEILLGLLQKEGYEVTQATLSRDMKLLKIGKISDGNNGYIYALPNEEERQESELTVAQDFLRGYISIECSGNIAVIKTYSGHADVVASALDTLALDEVIGTIAGGDNCVFACLREGYTGDQFIASLKKRIPDVEE